jgi:hypothetical protein
VSSLFSGGSRRGDGRDQELVDAADRRQKAFARDIGDESALSRGNQPKYRRPGMWLVVFIIVAAIVGGVRAFQHNGGPGLTRSCTTPALAISPATAQPGASIQWSGTGPATGQYALVFDGSPNSRTNTFTMTSCRTHDVITVPSKSGTHTLRLFHRTNGKFAAVAHITVKVR